MCAMLCCVVTVVVMLLVICCWCDMLCDVQRKCIVCHVIVLHYVVLPWNDVYDCVLVCGVVGYSGW